MIREGLDSYLVFFLFPCNSIDVFRVLSSHRVLTYPGAGPSNKARMIWTLIWAIMSSLLYLLSYSLVLFFFFFCFVFFLFCFILFFFFCFVFFLLISTSWNGQKKVDADKGIAPLYSGHEPNMLLLHQSALIIKGI